MTESQLSKTMYALTFIGLGIAGVGLGLAVFTDRVSKGDVADIMLISLLIAGGLLISIPAKLYLTYQLMRSNDKRASEKREKLQA
ncbi:MAG: Unknown protein [uncultured Thiotrichaceae bacterium]|uniref:Uncharacterized protein n=1 Tax=uncultured Thiotrichaceae bacterium TaxID=298394 RepID=A0A6S6T7Y8_9GAMM|nr:MAG: Unknown protein [uncultured Thiotrichaceae bacterium]